MGLGFNLCVVPPRDHGVPSLEEQGFGKGIGAGRYWGMKGQGAEVNSELMEL